MPLPSLETMVVVLASVGGFASVLAVALPFLGGDQRAARLKLVAKRRQELSQQQRAEFEQRGARRRPQAHVSAMKSLLQKINLQSLLASNEIKQTLSAAGWRGQSAVIVFVFSRIAGAIGGGLLAFLFVAVQNRFKLSLPAEAAAVLGAVAIGFYMPQIMAKNAAQKRQQEMTLNFPDALDLLLICVESGLSVEAAFSRVTEEISESSPVLSQEFSLVGAELAYLGDRRKAYANFAERTGLPAAKSLATTLTQADKYGTSVAVALKVLATENRDERMSKAEKKAGALPAQLTVPMIVFFLPALFLVIIGPAIINITKL
jgi:tight adherence protein C